MSDERFDQDLRTVLSEDAPSDVPDDLRRRVAEVSATPVAIHAARAPWRRPALLRIGALAAIVGVVAFGLWRYGLAPGPGVGGPPSSPSSAPVPSPDPSNAVGACAAAELAGRITGWEGAAGSRIAGVEVSNTGPTRCVVRGTPGLQLVDAKGQVLIDSATSGPDGQPHIGPSDPAFELAPGAFLQTDVRASNYCGLAPALPVEIAFTLPEGGGRFLVTPESGVSSDTAVPPCLGPTGGDISMNGWRP